MDQNTATVLIALIGLVGSLGAAGFSAWAAVRVGSVGKEVTKATAAVATVVTDVAVVKGDVRKVELATNSMKDELVRMSRAEGKQEGKDESQAALEKTAKDVEAGRKIERVAPPAPPVIPAKT